MFTIILPLDSNRLEQFKHTKIVYDAMPEEKEFILPTRNLNEVEPYLKEHGLTKDVKLIAYELKIGFNPSLALNIGIRNAKYDTVIISSPEVKPQPDLLSKLSELIGQNVVCQVFDQLEDGSTGPPLVNSSYRNETPGFYFLAMYNKKDIESINGWDEDFIKGYAYDDNDFGNRWNRAGLPFTIRDDLTGLHQFHPRFETIENGWSINKAKLDDNDKRGLVWVENGLIKGKQ